MKLYNSLTRTKDEFIPHEPGKVSMYTCGPTVYHFAHIGNLRTYIMEDVLEKYLRYTGLEVKRVMNITDVGHLASDLAGDVAAALVALHHIVRHVAHGDAPALLVVATALVIGPRFVSFLAGFGI